MKRNVSMNEISDGKFYELNDLVKAGCNDCKGCSTCCQGMGSSIVLDPLDMYRLLINLNKTFEELLIDKIELNIQDGIIIPNLKMMESPEKCSFLNNKGRCEIHAFRPGICRLFPLGRYYENHDFKYFLQVHECERENKTKIKVKKWIDTTDLKSNECFVIDWHYFLVDLKTVARNMQDDHLNKNINMYLLKEFYMKSYDTNIDFYLQFNERLKKAKEFVTALNKEDNIE